MLASGVMHLHITFTLTFQSNVRTMVNGLHLLSAFIQSALQYCLTFTNSYTHSYNDTQSYTDSSVNHARQQQPTHQGLLVLAQGHLDTESFICIAPTTSRCHTCSVSVGIMHSITHGFPLHCQMVSEKGFEVPRRIYVDFDGFALKRKFLMGLEPESIRMTIGETL